jgi:hypothetical protein
LPKATGVLEGYPLSWDKRYIFEEKTKGMRIVDLDIPVDPVVKL